MDSGGIRAKLMALGGITRSCRNCHSKPVLAGIRPLIGISDLFEHKQPCSGEKWACCYLADSVVDESNFVGLEQTKKMRMI
jgi:hypothetical protein